MRDRAKRLGATWRKEQRLWEITFRDSKRLAIADMIVASEGQDPFTGSYARAYGAIDK